MLKKCLASLTAFLLCWLFGGNAPARHTYLPENRVFFPEHGCRLEPSLDFNILAADLIIDAAVAAKGKVYFHDICPPPEGYRKTAYTEFILSVQEAWYGECEPNIILHIPGSLNTAVAKPLKNDRLILFLERDKAAPNVYCLVDAEYSMFAVNPDGSLYAFGLHKDFTCYDGEKPFILHAAIQKKIEHIDEIYEQYFQHGIRTVRSVAKKYLSPENLSEEEEMI